MESGLLERTAALLPPVLIYASVHPPGCSEVFIHGQVSAFSKCTAAWMR
jgi:hypothetical protein